MSGHVNLLFVKTLEDVNLLDETTDGLKLLLHDHQETFASSSANLVYLSIIKHDIDTGDTRPIKQSSRRPTISASYADDEILNEMLGLG